MKPVNLTINNFHEEVMESDKKVLIDFWSPGCIPCNLFGFTIDKVAKERPDVKVCKVNVDREMELAEQFKVRNIPTLVIMEDGKQTARALGIRTKKQVFDVLDGIEED